MYRILLALLMLSMLLMPAQAEQAFFAEALFEDFSGFIKENASMRFYGTLRANAPIRKVEAQCWDVRQMELFGEYIWQAQEGDGDAFELSLYDMRRDLFPAFRAGEFRVVITVHGDSGSCVAFDRHMYISGDLAAPRNMNADCVFDCSQKREYVWDDGRVSSEWLPQSPDDILRITLPEGRSAKGISLNWQTMPEITFIRAYDASGALLIEHTAGEGVFTPWHCYYAIPAGACSIEVEIPNCDAAVSELLVIEKDYVPAAVQKWRETAEKWDLMVISTHQDDEHLFFGAVIPEYVSRGKEVGIVYMVNCGRNRYSEALNGLWAAGLTNYPVFLGMRDGIIDSKKAAYNYWGGAETVVMSVVEQIRYYKPEVVLTHDFGGEYDNNQHKVVAECVAEAVELAADPAFHPESAEKYGVWQAKKLYIHLYDEQGEVTFDWNLPIEGFDGMTGLEISQMCYNYHRSQQKWVQYNLGLAYDNYRFGLYSSAVGPDTGKNDLFENIEQ